MQSVIERVQLAPHQQKGQHKEENFNALPIMHFPIKLQAASRRLHPLHHSKRDEMNSAA